MTRANLPALLIAVSAGVLTASAEAHADSKCLKDAQRFCPNIPWGEGRVLTCLQARFGDLSSACQQEIQQIQNRSAEITQACVTDLWQYCQNVAPGAGRLQVCLLSRWDNLSSTCRDTVSEISQKAQGMQDYCADDIERLCYGIRPGGGQLYLCLKAQESQVSVQCRSVLR